MPEDSLYHCVEDWKSALVRSCEQQLAQMQHDLLEGVREQLDTLMHTQARREGKGE